MTDNKPFFSIICCCYNSAKYIEETINSVLRQSFEEWELILIDDGSSDETLSIIKRYKKINYKIRIHSQVNSGLAVSRNKGIKLALSEWIVIIDHDDIWEFNKLQIQSQDIINKPTNYLFFY